MTWPANRPWSYSALDAFELCAHNFYQTRVRKPPIAEPDRPGMSAGGDVHKQIESYIQHGTKLPIGLRKFEHVIAKVTGGAIDVITEGRGGITADQRMTEFFGDDVSCRLVIDMLAVYPDSSILLDWKSSSAPRESEDQLLLYALYSLIKYPQHVKAHAEFVYTKFPSRTLTLTRPEMPRVVEIFRPRIEKLDLAHKTNTWPKRKCFKCKGWCPVTSCEFNEGKRR